MAHCLGTTVLPLRKSTVTIWPALTVYYRILFFPSILHNIFFIPHLDVQTNLNLQMISKSVQSGFALLWLALSLHETILFLFIVPKCAVLQWLQLDDAPVCLCVCMRTRMCLYVWGKKERDR